MEQLFVWLLYEDWDEKKYQILGSDKMTANGSVKGTLQWFHDLETYCRELEWNVIPRKSVYLNPKQFVEGIRDGKTGVFDETIGKQINPNDFRDFGMMAYCVLKFCIKDCTYTIMGDISRNIHFGYGLNDWEELKALLLTNETDSFGVLKKSYRNTVEISEFATNILHHGQFSVYPVEPSLRSETKRAVK